ncbi:MAG: hypothetical protein GX119_11940 [Syntrophomonadaceae bacterium]|jgi:hypothetical protein|nr:hypothetical protein [Syntrophomonadaceae bacterium]
MNADLQILAASGVGVSFDKNTTSYDNLKANSLKSTNVTAISANPNAKVLLKDAVDTVLAEETGAVTYTLPLLIKYIVCIKASVESRCFLYVIVILEPWK